MATHIGGRLEAVAPRQSLFGPDYVRLLALAAVSLAVHGWLLTHTALTARDGLEFARYALILRHPSLASDPPDPDRQFVDVLHKPFTEQHPGYPAAVLVVSKVVRSVTDLPLTVAMPLAAQIATALAGVLLVVPTYLLGRMLFGRPAAFATALLVQVLPVYAQTMSDALSEGPYLLAATTALVFAVRALRGCGVGSFLLAGACCGLAYLVRPEGGVFLPAAISVVVGLQAVTRRWAWDAAAGRLVALGVGFALVGGPYMAVIGGLTNKTTANIMLNPSGGPPNWRGLPTSAAPHPGGTPLLAVWWDPTVDTGSNRTLWGVRSVVRETLKTAHYVPAVLGLLGMIVFRRRIATDPGATVLVLLAAINAAALVHMTTSARTDGGPPPYVSERHTTLIGIVFCLFTAGVLPVLTASLARIPGVGRFWAGPHSANWVLVAIVLSGLPNALKPLHKSRVGHYYAGQFLASHVGPDDAVIDPFSWAQWYAGRTLYHVPKDPDEAKLKVRWAVLEHITAENPHSRLPRLQAALDVANDRVNPATVAYHWPEDVPVENAKVLVYRQVVKK